MQKFHSQETTEAQNAARSAFVLMPSDTVDNYHGDSVATQFTVPSLATMCVFSANGDFYALYGSNPTAVIPSGDVTDGSASILNPAAWRVAAGMKISVIALAGVDVTMLWYD